MAETIYSVVDDSVVLGLHLVEEGAGVAGQTPTLEIRRLRDGRYLDFAAVSAPYWKTSGGSKEKTLVPKSYLPGLYTWTFDQSVYDPGVRESYVAIYRNAGPDYPVEITEFHDFTYEWEKDVKFIRDLLENNSMVEEISDNEVHHTWYADNGTDEVLKHKITKAGAIESREKIP